MGVPPPHHLLLSSWWNVLQSSVASWIFENLLFFFYIGSIEDIYRTIGALVNQSRESNLAAIQYGAGVYVYNDFAIKSTYIEDARNYFGVEVKCTDFKNQNVASTELINKWVELDENNYARWFGNGCHSNQHFQHYEHNSGKKFAFLYFPLHALTFTKLTQLSSTFTWGVISVIRGWKNFLQ